MTSVDLNLLVSEDDCDLAILNVKLVAKTVLTAIKTKTVFKIKLRVGRTVVNPQGFKLTIFDNTLSTQQYHSQLTIIATGFCQAGFSPDPINQSSDSRIVSLIRLE